MKNRKYLIDEFYKIDFNNTDETGKLLVELEEYIAAHEPDVQLELITHTVRANNADGKFASFTTLCELTAPAIALLQDMQWGHVELTVLGTCIGRIECYTTTVNLMEKALGILKKDYSNDSNLDGLKGIFLFNVTLRLLRAKFYDKIKPEKLAALFTQCSAEAIALCEKKNLSTMRTVLLTRKAIFDGNVTKILECIDGLRATEEPAWIQTTSDEIAEYCRHLGPKINKELRQFMYGYRIQKRRKELGITTAELSEFIDSDQSVVNQIERGLKGISIERLEVIARVLQVPMGYILGDDSTLLAVPGNIILHKFNTFVEKQDEADQEFLYKFAKQYVAAKNEWKRNAETEIE